MKQQLNQLAAYQPGLSPQALRKARYRRRII